MLRFWTVVSSVRLARMLKNSEAVKSFYRQWRSDRVAHRPTLLKDAEDV